MKAGGAAAVVIHSHMASVACPHWCGHFDT